jgi:putative transposase
MPPCWNVRRRGRARRSITYYDQTRELTELRAESPEYRTYSVEILREPLRRIDHAFRAFFRRVKAGERPGYPRFRSPDRYNSFALSRFRVEGHRVLVPKLGALRMRLHRPLRGQPSRASILRSGKRWRVSITCEVGPTPEKRAITSAVGIDAELENFLTLSDGQAVENPRWLKKSEEELARVQRKLSSKKRRSGNRRKARQAVVRCHERIASRRRNFCHHVSKWLVSTYELIGFEKLKIQGMART